MMPIIFPFYLKEKFRLSDILFLYQKSKLFSQIVIHYESNAITISSFQALYSKSKHFSNFENITQVFPASVKNLVLRSFIGQLSHHCE